MVGVVEYDKLPGRCPGLLSDCASGARANGPDGRVGGALDWRVIALLVHRNISASPLVQRGQPPYGSRNGPAPGRAAKLAKPLIMLYTSRKPCARITSAAWALRLPEPQ